jgi:ribose-phosphate pyrophosphokinase
MGIIVFGGTGNHDFDEEVIRLVNLALNTRLDFSHCWHETFPDGEPNFGITEPNRVKGKHVLIFSCPTTDELRSELRDLITATKHQYSAETVTIILSFLPYRRQDRSELTHEITRLRWFLRDLKHWGTNQLIVCEPHSYAATKRYAKEFEIQLRLADPTPIFADTIRPLIQTLGGSENVRIYSPDFGSVGRAIALAKQVGAKVIATPKRRINMRVEAVTVTDFLERVQSKYPDGAQLVSCETGDLAGLHLIMREDEVDTGGTAVATAGRLRDAGAESVRLIATHPVCSRGWKKRLFPYGERQPFETVWLGDTRPRGQGGSSYKGSTGGRVTQVGLAPAVAKELIRVLEELLKAQ